MMVSRLHVGICMRLYVYLIGHALTTLSLGCCHVDLGLRDWRYAERMNKPAATYKNHRFPIEIVAHAVWLCHQFGLSRREVEEMVPERGIAVSYETIRRGVSGMVMTMPAVSAQRRRRVTMSGMMLWTSSPRR